LPQVKGYRNNKGNLTWGKQSGRAYLEAIRARYRRADKAGKSAILNEFCAVCDYHRKYALRAAGCPAASAAIRRRKPGPTSRYDTPELVEALRIIWMASDQLCGKRLKAALPLWLPHYGRASNHCRRYARFARLNLGGNHRPLAPAHPGKVGRKGFIRHQAGLAAEEHIPIQAGAWDVTQPGFIEADTVAHCGDSLGG